MNIESVLEQAQENGLLAPLKMDDTGTIRVYGTRVTLDSIINLHTLGSSPEDLHEAFPSLPLYVIYYTLGLYHELPDEFNSYLSKRKEEIEKVISEGNIKIWNDDLKNELIKRK